MTGDFNARNKLWDHENNAAGKELEGWRPANRYKISSAQTPSYPSKRGSKGKKTRPSNIDLLLHNWNRDIEVKTTKAPTEAGGSDHLPIQLTARTSGGRGRRVPRVPKTLRASHNVREEARIRYNITMTLMVRQLKETTRESFDEDMYTAEEEIKNPWTEKVRERHRHHPTPWWTEELNKKKKAAHKAFLQWKKDTTNDTLARKRRSRRTEYKR